MPLLGVGPVLVGFFLPPLPTTSYVKLGTRWRAGADPLMREGFVRGSTG